MQVIATTASSALPLACAALARGELVIYPTETCYGLAVDASNEAAVTKLLAYKGDRHRQVSIAVDSQAMAEHYVELNPIAQNLYRHFLPGPITVISSSLHQLDPRLESGTGTLGVRFPSDPFALALVRSYGKPLTATSANTSGKKEPYSLADWQKYTTQSKQAFVSVFLDAGTLAERPTSTVVDTTLNSPEILRQGELFLPNTPTTTHTTRSVQDTLNLGKILTQKYLNVTRKHPLIFALQGELGAGKTQFSKGIAQALALTDTITSPTYTLLHEYPYQTAKYQGVFYHLDTWRLPDSAELESTLNLSALLLPGNILSLEWASKAKTQLSAYQDHSVIIYLDIKEIDPSTRTITYTVSHPEWS